MPTILRSLWLLPVLLLLAVPLILQGKFSAKQAPKPSSPEQPLELFQDLPELKLTWVQSWPDGTIGYLREDANNVVVASGSFSPLTDFMPGEETLTLPPPADLDFYREHDLDLPSQDVEIRLSRAGGVLDVRMDLLRDFDDPYETFANGDLLRVEERSERPWMASDGEQPDRLTPEGYFLESKASISRLEPTYRRVWKWETEEKYYWGGGGVIIGPDDTVYAQSITFNPPELVVPGFSQPRLSSQVGMLRLFKLGPQGEVMWDATLWDRSISPVNRILVGDEDGSLYLFGGLHDELIFESGGTQTRLSTQYPTRSSSEADTSLGLRLDPTGKIDWTAQWEEPGLQLRITDAKLDPRGQVVLLFESDSAFDGQGRTGWYSLFGSKPLPELGVRVISPALGIKWQQLISFTVDPDLNYGTHGSGLIMDHIGRVCVVTEYEATSRTAQEKHGFFHVPPDARTRGELFLRFDHAGSEMGRWRLPTLIEGKGSGLTRTGVITESNHLVRCGLIMEMDAILGQASFQPYVAKYELP